MRLHINIHAGADTVILRGLGEFGLGEEHIKSFFGKRLELVANFSLWLEERHKVESGWYDGD